MIKRSLILLALLPILCGAQTVIAPLAVTEQQFKEWDTEINLDTIDQENLPKKVTGGLMLMANISNFIIRQNSKHFSSYMKVGGDLGGFVDFTVTKHFAIQGRLVLTVEQNHFEDTHEANHLYSFGVDIPVLFLARFGNMQKGYLSFGGGPFTHFTYASNIGKYTNTEKTPKQIIKRETAPNTSSVYDLYTLHDNHSGLVATISYEFPIGLQIVANYMVSLTDIATFYKQNPTAVANHTSFYPQRVELGLAYRWKHNKVKSESRNKKSEIIN